MKLKEYYKESFDILKNKKILVLVMFSIYILAFVSSAAYHISKIQPNEKEAINPEKEKLKQEAIKEYIKIRIFQESLDIFTHNTLASLIRIPTGLLLGAPPTYSVILSAYTTSGWLIKKVSSKGFLPILRYLPHVIIEAIALTLSSVLGVMWFLSLLKKDRAKRLKQTIKNSIIIFLTIILPLLLLSSILETVSLLI
ncbi:hypothetical protein DRJ22_03410 [Candidatus Woesearchaeota archaeon]|nr:MAG: hypothetical protein DRJ22_03410 [Candidatus Woesearchaeota archaeon]